MELAKRRGVFSVLCPSVFLDLRRGLPAVGVSRTYLEPLFVEHKGMINSVLEGNDFRVLEDFILSHFPGLMAVMFESLGEADAHEGGFSFVFDSSKQGFLTRLLLLVSFCARVFPRACMPFCVCVLCVCTCAFSCVCVLYSATVLGHVAKHLQAGMTGDLTGLAPGEVGVWCTLLHGFMAYVFLRLAVRNCSWRLRILALKMLSGLFGATGS